MMAEAVARYLAAQGEGTWGTDLFLAVQPDEPDDNVTFMDEGTAALPESQALQVDQVGVQVLVRAAAYEDARSKIWSIHKKLLGFGGELYTGFPIVSMIGIQSIPQYAGPDERSRHEWSAHYTVRFVSTGDQWRK